MIEQIYELSKEPVTKGEIIIGLVFGILGIGLIYNRVNGTLAGLIGFLALMGTVSSLFSKDEEKKDEALMQGPFGNHMIEAVDYGGSDLEKRRATGNGYAWNAGEENQMAELF